MSIERLAPAIEIFLHEIKCDDESWRQLKARDRTPRGMISRKSERFEGKKSRRIRWNGGGETAP